MPDSGERAYAYAKACGIIGKSFVGKRVSALAGLRTLSELDRLVFPEIHRELPGRELLPDLECRITNRAMRHIMAVLDAYEKPPELFCRLLRAAEYTDLKTCLRHIAGGIRTVPAHTDIGSFGTVRFEAYPDLAAMLAGTEFEFILSKDITAMRDDELAPVEAELDLHYYTLLLESVRRLSAADRLLPALILAEEISLRNCVWALRLRTYFEKNSEETAKQIMNLTMSAGYESALDGIGQRMRPGGGVADGGEISLAAEALKSLSFPLDVRAAWNGWRWESLLNADAPGESWTADPRHFQNAASEYLYQMSLRCFRRMPFHAGSVFCFIKLKGFEEDLLTSVAEGLGMGMQSSEVFDLLGGK
jgi:vacuolar-type H+-ATPase subunit C/Vma6